MATTLGKISQPQARRVSGSIHGLRMSSFDVMERECGDCRVCCTVTNIPELSKPAGVPCQHLSGLRTGPGCARYLTRPLVCQDYLCCWMQGLGLSLDIGRGTDLRPDRLGLLCAFWPNYPGIVPGLLEFSIIAQELNLGAFRRPLAQRALYDAVHRGLIVLVFRPPSYDVLKAWMGPDDVLPAAEEWCRTHGHSDLTGILQR